MKVFKKKLLATKAIILFFILLITPVSQAQQEQKHDNIRQAVYSMIGYYDFLTASIASAITSGVICGPWCAVVGGIAGSLDEFLIHLGCTNKRYITWGIFGMAAANAVHPSDLSGATGAVIGVLLPTGLVQQHPKVIAPTTAAVAGYMIAGLPGLISGGILGIADELKIRNGLGSTHDFTLSATGMAITQIIQRLPLFAKDCAGLLLGEYMSRHEEEFINNIISTATTINQAHELCGKFVPPAQFNNHIEKQLLALVGNQYLTQFLSLKMSGYGQRLTYNFERLDDKTGGAQKRLNSEMMHFAVFLFPYLIGQTSSQNINDYFSTKLQDTVTRQVKDKLFSDEVMLKLSHNNDTSVLINNLDSDITALTDSSVSVITNTASAAINGAYGLGIIVVTSPNIFIYHLLYNQATAFISNELITRQNCFNTKITELDTKLTDILAHDMKNIRTITEKNGVNVTKNKIQQLSQELKEYKEIRKLWSIMTNMWWSVSGTADSIFNYYLVSKEISNNHIPFEDRRKMQMATWQVSGLFSSMRNNIRSRSGLNTSLNRVLVLEGLINVEHSIDKVIRSLTDEQQLIIKNLIVKIKDRTLLTINNFSFDMGKVYAITGESGSGKTSLFSKIKGIKENNIEATGNIYYPTINGQAPNIVMLSQQDYFPLDASLQEVIIYPNTIPTDTEQNKQQRELIQNLLYEIGLLCFDNSTLTLDSKKNWDTVFSGGEKRKVALISAILQKPDILILDEIFNGMDKNSIQIAQVMLKKYLPNSLLLIVDHHAENNNFTGFYTNKLKLADSKLILDPITKGKVI